MNKFLRTNLAITLIAIPLLSITLLTFGAGVANANSIISSTPSANAVLNTTPNIVTLQLQTALNQTGSTLSVLDPSGNEVDDRSVTINGTTIAVGMQQLTASGNYTVNYALFSDTDQPLIGSYQFTFNSPGNISSSNSNTNTSTSNNSNSNSSNNSSSNSSNNSSNSTQSNSTNNTKINSSQNTNLNNSLSSGNTFIYILMGSALFVLILLLWYTYFLIKKARR